MSWCIFQSSLFDKKIKLNVSAQRKSKKTFLKIVFVSFWGPPPSGQVCSCGAWQSHQVNSEHLGSTCCPTKANKSQIVTSSTLLHHMKLYFTAKSSRPLCCLMCWLKNEMDLGQIRCWLSFIFFSSLQYDTRWRNCRLYHLPSVFSFFALLSFSDRSVFCCLLSAILKSELKAFFALFLSLCHQRSSLHFFLFHFLSHCFSFIFLFCLSSLPLFHHCDFVLHIRACAVCVQLFLVSMSIPLAN